MLADRTVVVATALPDSARTGHPGYAAPDLTLSFAGPGRNVAVDPPALEHGLGASLPPRLRDLLEIATTVYAADVAFPRGENEAWVRQTRFLLPVREAAFWRDAEPQLAEALYVLSHDGFVFDFCDRREPDVVVPAPGEPLDADCVALLSGGIDSFAGASMLLATGRRPLLVAHRPHNPMVVRSQEHVCACLRGAFGQPVRFVPFGCGPTRGAETDFPYPPPEARETSQRTRSFLFMTLGALACHATGAGELFCPENGVLAVNAPLTAARVGGYSTAGTRPRTLARFGELLRTLGLPVRLTNPFLYQTKAQLIRDILRRYYPPDAIQGAISCWMAGRLSRACGACIPCLVRAIAMRAAGLPPEAHDVDPLGTGGRTGPESAARANLVDLMVFVRRLRTLSDAQLLEAYPVLLDLPPEADVASAVAMLRRFAAEALDSLTHVDLAGELDGT